MLSDQLIVTGITVLIAGFAQSGTLSIYHFQVVTWLAWLASNAHQVTLGVLRNYLREHRTVLRYRLVAMGAIYVMLMCAVAFAGASILYSSFSSYTYALDSAVSCTWDAKAFRALPADTVFSLCVLSVSFTSRILKLFVTTSDLAEKYFRQKPGQWLKRQYYCAANPTPTGTVSAFFCRVKAFAIIVTYVNARAIFDTYTSDVFELIWLTLSFTYGSAQLFRWRSFTQGIINENSWSFGQLLAPLSLILPLLALPEVYAGEWTATPSIHKKDFAILTSTP
jgi:ABC-type antimicrobial peptide transport system permease subunit